MMHAPPDHEGQASLLARAATSRKFGRNEVRWGTVYLVAAVLIAIASFFPQIGHWLMWLALLLAVVGGITLIRGRGELHHARVLEHNAGPHGQENH